MKKIAVVCCYNRDDLLESMLEEGLTNQKNVNILRKFYYNMYPSAASAYNQAIQDTPCDYYVFVHQDIKFLQEDFLEKTIECIDSNPEALYGLCGTVKTNNSYETISNTFHGLWNKRIGCRTIDEVVQVQGLDEIFVACHRCVFDKIRFDEKTFDGWHIFVADLCLQAQLVNIPVFVMPFNSQHKNSLEMPNYMMVYKILPDEYFVYLKRLREKYKNRIEEIITPCIVIRTRCFDFWKKYLFIRFVSKYRKLFRKLSMK